MGKFRKGELATRCIGGSVDLGDLTLHYGPPLGPAISRPDVKRSVPQHRWARGPNGFELLVGIHGAGRFRWSQVSRVRSTTTRSEDLVSPRSATPVGRSRRTTVVMESKRQADRRRTF